MRLFIQQTNPVFMYECNDEPSIRKQFIYENGNVNVYTLNRPTNDLTLLRDSLEAEEYV